MREILFRGRHHGKWIVGTPVHDEHNEWWYIIPHDAIISPNGFSYMLEVDPETVGQYTGLKDENGMKIFEGDILKVLDWNNDMDPFDSNCGFGNVEYLERWGMWYVSGGPSNGLSELKENGYLMTVIGNIHDNPELLEVRDE